MPSGVINHYTNVFQIQSEIPDFSFKVTKETQLKRPEIRKSRRNVCNKMKDVIATVSYKAAISIEKARVAVQTVDINGSFWR